MTAGPAPDGDAIADQIQAASATVLAPHDLRRRIDRERRLALRRRGLRVRRVARAAAAVTAACAVAIAVFAADLRSGDPSLADAARVALRAPTSTLPAGSREGPALRAPTIDGVAFSNFEYRTGNLRAIGVRQDRSRGRQVVIVSYADGGGGRIAYGIVAAPALDVPAAARRVTYRGMHFAVLHSGTATVVTWRRQGHTCILASREASQARLLGIGATDRA